MLSDSGLLLLLFYVVALMDGDASSSSPPFPSECGQVLQASRGQILLESYPLNAHCEWTIHAKPGFVVELR